MKNIPKICYLYWNTNPMALLYLFTIYSFHKYNPDWKIVLCILNKDDAIDRQRFNPPYRKYTGTDYFPVIKTLDYVEIRILDTFKYSMHSILVSDIWRREVLFETGGVYSDIDMLWLKPIEEIKNIDCIGNPNDFEALVSFYNYTSGFHNVSNLIAEKGSPFFKAIMEKVSSVKKPYGDQAFGTDLLNKLYPDLSSIIQDFPRILAVKYETFYPYSTFNLRQLFVEDDLTVIENKNVLGIHWFSGNEVSKEYINSGHFNKCSMTSILKREGYL
jgi:hypothetical protein